MKSLTSNKGFLFRILFYKLFSPNGREMKSGMESLGSRPPHHFPCVWIKMSYCSYIVYTEVIQQLVLSNTLYIYTYVQSHSQATNFGTQRNMGLELCVEWNTSWSGMLPILLVQVHWNGDAFFIKEYIPPSCMPTSITHGC